MKDAIVEKLRAALDSGLDTECKIFYVLGQARKLLEKFPPDPPQFALALYCNWALHVDLDRPKTTLHFLARVDQFVASILGLKDEDLISKHYLFREFVFLDSFRSQLRELLSKYGLPMALCDDDDRWNAFIQHYAGIIEDGSLSCDGKNLQLKLVRKVVFAKGREQQDSHVPFDLSWQIELLDGRGLTFEGHAVAPKELQMMVTGIKFTDAPAAVDSVPHS